MPAPLQIDLQLTSDGENTLLALTLENTGRQSLQNWSLHLDFPRYVTPAADTSMLPRIGSHLEIAAQTSVTLAPNSCHTLRLHGDAQALQRHSDLPAGLYVTADGAVFPAQLRSHNLDEYLPARAASSEAPVERTVPLQPVIPCPAVFQNGEGIHLLEGRITVCITPAAEDAFSWLQQMLSTPLNTVPTTSDDARLLFKVDDSLPPEAYKLAVSKTSVVLTAAGHDGFCRGAATLLQLVDLKDNDQQTLPCLSIEDEPRFAYRGLMLDCVRHFHTPETVLDFLDWMALYKFNHFHWHLTDDEGWRLPIDTLPQLTDIGAWRGAGEQLEPQFGSGPERYGGFYSRAQIQQIIARAAQLGITVIPEIDIPGHCRAAIRSLPDLLIEAQDESRYCSVQYYTDNVLNPGLPGTYQFLETVLDTVCELFPGPYVHLGADEVPAGVWQQSPACQEMMAQYGYSEALELQGHLLRHAQNFLAQRGRVMMAWEEAAHGDKLDHSAPICAWTAEQAIVDVVGAGYPVISCPAPWAYHDLAWSDDPNEPGLHWAGTADLRACYEHSPLPLALGEAQQQRVIGVQANLWGELISSPQRLQYMLFPRMLATAESAWHRRDNKDWPEFRARAERQLQALRERGVFGRPLGETD